MLINDDPKYKMLKESYTKMNEGILDGIVSLIGNAAADGNIDASELASIKAKIAQAIADPATAKTNMQGIKDAVIAKYGEEKGKAALALIAKASTQADAHADVAHSTVAAKQDAVSNPKGLLADVAANGVTSHEQADQLLVNFTKEYGTGTKDPYAIAKEIVMIAKGTDNTEMKKYFIQKLMPLIQELKSNK